MSMVSKNSYVIDGEVLQEIVQQEMGAVIHCYVASKLTDDTDLMFSSFEAHKAVFREYLAIQGNNHDEVATIYNYTIDIANMYVKSRTLPIFL